MNIDYPSLTAVGVVVLVFGVLIYLLAKTAYNAKKTREIKYRYTKRREYENRLQVFDAVDEVWINYLIVQSNLFPPQDYYDLPEVEMEQLEVIEGETISNLRVRSDIDEATEEVEEDDFVIEVEVDIEDEVEEVIEYPTIRNEGMDEKHESIYKKPADEAEEEANELYREAEKVSRQIETLKLFSGNEVKENLGIPKGEMHFFHGASSGGGMSSLDSSPTPSPSPTQSYSSDSGSSGGGE